MEEEDGVAYRRGGSAMGGSDTLALNYSQMASAGTAGSVDLVGRLKTLSSGRKKLMTKYFDLDDIESGPLLSEYFAVSLAFVALGAMIREANVRMRRKDKENSDGVSPKLQRMALDSMLKSAMERLRGLVHRTQTLEDKVRDRSYMEAAFQFERLEFLKRISNLEVTIEGHAEEKEAWRREKEDLVKRIAEVDAQRGYFFKKMAEAESSLADLQRLRMEDGKANAKLVEIYAGREQSWKSERVKLRHDIELLKELNKLPPQSQSKSPHSFDAAADALRIRNFKRRAKEMVRDKAVSDRELSVLAGADRSPKSEVDSRSPKQSPMPADERKDLEADTHELSAAQNQEMEAELAIILKRVGVLKRRGTSGSKLDELLNEAKGKSKLKRLGSFDQAPKGMVVDDTFLCRPEANNVKDVEIDEGAKDIWQAIEFQEGMNAQRHNGLVDRVKLPREPSRMRVFDSSELIHEILTTPEKNIILSQRPSDGAHSPLRMNALDSGFNLEENPLTPEKSNAGDRTSQGLAAVNHNIFPDVAVHRSLASDLTVRCKEVEPLNLDEGGWEEFVLENPSTPEKPVGQSTTTSEVETFVDDDRASESVAVYNSYLASEPGARSKVQPRNLDEVSWEEFNVLEKKPNSPEKSNIGERASEGLTASEGVAVNRGSASELSNCNEIEAQSLDKGGWEELVQEKSNNIGQRTPEGLPVAAPEVVAANSVLTAEPTVCSQNETPNLDEGAWVESADYNSGWELEFKGYAITRADAGSPDKGGEIPVDDLMQFGEDIKSEIIVNKDQPEEPSIGPHGHQIEAKDSAPGTDLTSAECGSSGEIPEATPALVSAGHRVVDNRKLAEDDVKSEIILSNPIPCSSTLGTGNDHDLKDQLNRTDVSEGANALTGQLSPDQMNMASLEPKHLEFNGGS